MKKVAHSLPASVAACTIVFAAVGCGTGRFAAPVTASPSGTVTQVRMGDSPADEVFSFELTIGGPILLFASSGGAPAAIGFNPNRLELSHTAAKLQPIAITTLPAGTYSSAEINIQSPSATFAKSLLAPTPITLIDRVTGPDQTVTVNFDPPLVVGADPVVLNLDVNLANSLVTSAAGGIRGIDFKPSSFTFSIRPVGAETQQQDLDGEVEGATGQATDIAGDGFNLRIGQSGSRLPFITDSSTVWSSGLSLAGLQNRIVQVEGFTRADGSLLARKIEALVGPSGAELEGMVTQMGSLGTAKSFSLAAQDGIGSGITSGNVGMDFMVDATALPDSAYTVDFGRCDTGSAGTLSLLFPFDSAHMKGGQRVQVETATGVAANQAILADQIRLEQQAVTGTVSGITPLPGGGSSFSLNLPSDSYLSLLSGETVLHIYQHPKTDNRFGAIAEGSSLRVRGLLFWDGTRFNMIARRITQP